jgi:hypothetical protein
MKLPRRNFLHLATVATVLPAIWRFAWAQNYPARPISISSPPTQLRFGARDLTFFGRPIPALHCRTPAARAPP